MKIQFTKLAVALISLGLVTISYANGSPWNITLGGQYQQFSNNGTTFAVNNSTFNNTETGYNIDPSYHFGYTLGVGYHIPDKDSDLDLTYHHLNSSDTDNVWGPSLTLGPDQVTPVTWAQSRLKFDYDDLSFTAGHTIKLTPSFDMRFYGGLDYTHLKKDMSTVGSSYNNTVLVNGGTDYNGFGPEFGLDGDCYPFPRYPRFSVLGGVNTELLFGTMTGYANFTQEQMYSQTNIPDQRIVVPGIGAKLGVNYNFDLGRDMKLGAQLGYRMDEYFGVTQDSTYTSNTNMSFEGPYALVKLSF